MICLSFFQMNEVFLPNSLCVESTPKVKETLQKQRLTKAEANSPDVPQTKVHELH